MMKAVSVIKDVPKEVSKFVPQRLPPMPSFKDLLRIYGVRSKKQLSQNFLMNGHSTRELVERCQLKPDHTVVEIGPGPGNITREILAMGPRELFVIEKDRRFLPILEMLADAAHPGQMKIIIGDALDYSLNNFFHPALKREWEDDPPPIHFVGNLPFNISTPLLIRWLRQMHSRTGPFAYGRVPLNLTFQWELAVRICSDVMEPPRNRLSAIVQMFSVPKRKLRIFGRNFYPKPEVDTGLVQLKPRYKPIVPLDIPFETIDKLTRCMFHLRFASVRKSCRILFPRSEYHLVEEMFRQTIVEPDDNAMMLSCEEISEVIQAYWKMVKDEPFLRDYCHTAPKREPKLLRDMFSETGLTPKKGFRREINLNE
ncbi:mitochondrial transcription factor B1 [Brevipalpus obovatus]|uniref:mitochondrial transcription factor B1 n=1 Tax=Brevipalpus obovatus TaxID=246614 RepID=UPI003D9F1462